ncbi:hypothetical protein H4R18_004326 [Coemansia javaensis]|uniref:RTA1 like protein n=1 Tax=Coemansia javaensis TaxID=2761396 RepID=A0A9W8H4K2_9FUNG|nr:hypothetical protein H4R18_004326 [Coemansia javaensis]
MVDPTYYFSYTPVNVAPEVAAAAFLGAAVVLAMQTFTSRGPRWLLVLPVTAFCEAVGYAFRTVCIYWTTLGTFTAMTLFLLLPPNALALTNYKTLGDVVRDSTARLPSGQAPRTFLLRPRFITWFFFASDVLSFLLQGAGVGISTQEGRRELAKQTVLAGLYVQLVFFAVFLGIAAYAFFDRRFVVRRGPRDATARQAKRRLFRVICLTTALLYVRSVYRVAEFVDGYGGRIYGTEYLFYVFDTLLVAASLAVYMQSFIGHHLRAPAEDPIKLRAYRPAGAGAGLPPPGRRL